MKKQYILSFLLLFSISISLTLPVAATGTSDIQVESFNEYDYIETIQDSSAQELEEMGMSVQEAEATVFAFENALFDRASLSDEELQAYGYDSSEIELLHAYADGQTLSSAELRSLGSTCTAIITRHSCSTKSAEFSYTFTWDRCPVMTLSDSAAMKWVVYDASGSEIGVQQVSRSMTIEYHFKGNAASSGNDAFAHYGVGTNQPNLDFNVLNMQFPVYQAHSSPNGVISDTYAKKGTVKVSVKVPTGVNQTIHHIFVGGLYGHTLLGVGSPAVTVSGGVVGIGFTGNPSIDSIASRRGTIYQNKTAVEYW